MTRKRVGVGSMLIPASAHGHSFGQQYNLPIPFWLYVYAASLALLLSFLVIGYFVTEAGAKRNYASRSLAVIDCQRGSLGWWLGRLFSATALLALVLNSLGGFIGTNHPYFNINMTLFWVVFVLGVTYVTAVFGDVFEYINPWSTLSRCLFTTMNRSPNRGRWVYPSRVGCFPGLALYLGFVWLELFSRMSPQSLSMALIAYTAITLAGSWAFGAAAWLQYGEFFGVYFRLIGKCAPMVWSRLDSGRVQVTLQQPFVGLVKDRPTEVGLLAFVLCILSTTAFDGFHETAPWVDGFWVHIYQSLTRWTGSNIVQTYSLYRYLFAAYQTIGLLGMPIVYLAMYLGCLRILKAITGCSASMSELSLRFAYTLIPIGLVYNFSHYFTLVVTQGVQLRHLVSDPLGLGWDLFGTAEWRGSLTVGAGVAWHTQVAMIVGGHLISVYLAHIVALDLFKTRRTALVSQLPMLVLMIAYTAIGLWILSLPIRSPRSRGNSTPLTGVRTHRTFSLRAQIGAPMDQRQRRMEDARLRANDEGHRLEHGYNHNVVAGITVDIARHHVACVSFKIGPDLDERPDRGASFD